MATNPDDKHPTDPAFSGAKAGAMGAGAAGDDFARPGAGGVFDESAQMSALLAENWWAIALRGVAGILFGLVALFMTGPTIGALVLLFAAYMLVDGIFAIIAGVRAAAHHQRWGALVFEGVVDLIAAAIAFFMPIATVLAFVWVTGAWAIVSGIMLLVATFRLHRTHGKWLMALGGIVSVIWGVLLFIAPIAGAVVMTWWLGAYALVFGVALLVLAFRLRSRRTMARGAVAA
jgi:uncharacterized membrane protein HdeD (DUF308 family)